MLGHEIKGGRIILSLDDSGREGDKERWRNERVDLTATVDYDKPTPSKSRIKTAICARFAASATSVKSLRKASVDDDDPSCGCRCGGAILVEGDCRVDDSFEVWCDVGDVMGAFMMAMMFAGGSRKMKCVQPRQ